MNTGPVLRPGFTVLSSWLPTATGRRDQRNVRRNTASLEGGQAGRSTRFAQYRSSQNGRAPALRAKISLPDTYQTGNLARRTQTVEMLRRTAPSSANAGPWDFVVDDNRNRRRPFPREPLPGEPLQHFGHSSRCGWRYAPRNSRTAGGHGSRPRHGQVKTGLSPPAAGRSEPAKGSEPQAEQKPAVFSESLISSSVTVPGRTSQALSVIHLTPPPRHLSGSSDKIVTDISRSSTDQKFAQGRIMAVLAANIPRSHGHSSGNYIRSVTYGPGELSRNKVPLNSQ